MTTDTPTPRTAALAEKWSEYIVLDGPHPMEWITFARELERELSAMRERVVKYRARLEIDRHAEDFGGQLERVDLPFDEDEPYDGIACRDETIRLLDQSRDELRADLSECHAALRELVAIEDDAERMYEDATWEPNDLDNIDARRATNLVAARAILAKWEGE